MTYKAPRGYTLIEVMIVVSIIAILSMTAVPAFARLINNGHIKSTSSQLITVLSVARQEAIRRNQNVLVVGKDIQGKDWRGGFQISSDTNNDQILDDDEIILIGEPSSTNIKVTSNSIRPNFKFMASGLIDDPSGMSFEVCSATNDFSGIKISILYSGQILREAHDCV